MTFKWERGAWLTLIKPLYGRLIKACQMHLYRVEGGSPQEMDRSEVGKHRRDQCPWSRPQRVLPSLCCMLGAGTAGAVALQHPSPMASSYFPDPEGNRDEKQKACVFGKGCGNGFMDIVCLQFLEPPLRQLPLPMLNLLCAVN